MTLETVYSGVRDTERGRIAVVIVVHMLYVARAAHAIVELVPETSSPATEDTLNARLEELADAVRSMRR